MPDTPKPAPIVRPQRVPEKCPHCGKTNYLTLNVIFSGYNCPKCGQWVDGIPVPDQTAPKIEYPEP